MTNRTATTPRRKSTVVPSGVYSPRLRPGVPPTRPRGHRDVRARVVRTRAGGRSSDSRARLGVRSRTRHLVAVASQARTSGPVRMTAVVPAHRCGAVPDSHRVPSYDASRLADGANQLHPPPYGLVAPEGSATSVIRTRGRDVEPGMPQGGKRRTCASRPSPATPRGTLDPTARRAPRPASNQALSPGRRCGIRGRSCGRGVRPPPSAGAAAGERTAARGTRRRATPRWR